MNLTSITSNKSKPAVTTRTDSKLPSTSVSPLRIRRADEVFDESVKILIYGDTGTGKTRSILGLLSEGLKVLYFSTEIGGTGLMTVRLEAPAEHLERLYEVEGLRDYRVITEFMRDPGKLLPDIYEIDPDVIFWDGLTEGQLVHLEEYIGEQIHLKNEREESDARRSGLQLEQRDWSMVLNGTVRMVKDYLYMHNTQTGRAWTKIATCKEAEKERVEDPANSDAKPKYKAKNTMLIHGGAKKLIEGGFDLILRTRVKSSPTKSEDREFLYCTAPRDNQTAKSRGIALPPEMPGDFSVVWQTISGALKAKKRPRVKETQ